DQRNPRHAARRCTANSSENPTRSLRSTSGTRRYVALRDQPLVDRLSPNENLCGEDNMKALRTLFVSAAAVGLLVIGSAAQAHDKTIKNGARFPMAGPGPFIGAHG